MVPQLSSRPTVYSCSKLDLELLRSLHWRPSRRNSVSFIILSVYQPNVTNVNMHFTCISMICSFPYRQDIAEAVDNINKDLDYIKSLRLGLSLNPNKFQTIPVSWKQKYDTKSGHNFNSSSHPLRLNYTLELCSQSSSPQRLIDELKLLIWVKKWQTTCEYSAV